MIARSFPDAVAGSCREIDALAGQIAAFFSGGRIRFSLDLLRMDLCSMFQRKVLRADRSIPRGQVSTYGLLGARIGVPGSARAVGTALAGNPFPIVIPCHRVVRSDGALGGFGGGVEMKRAMLELEGVSFRDAWHVAVGGFWYQ